MNKSPKYNLKDNTQAMKKIKFIQLLKLFMMKYVIIKKNYRFETTENEISADVKNWGP